MNQTQGTGLASYGSIGSRFVAFLIDSVIVAVPMTIASSIIPVIGGVVFWFFYAPIFESSSARATLGKYVMGLQVTDLSGGRITLRAAIIRNLLKLVSLAFLFIGFLFALFTARKQAVHDLLAETLVLNGGRELNQNVSLADAWTSNVREVFNSTGGSPNPNSAASSSAFGGSTMPDAAESVADQLERLKALRDSGALSEDEFQLAKQKILKG